MLGLNACRSDRVSIERIQFNSVVPDLYLSLHYAIHSNDDVQYFHISDCHQSLSVYRHSFSNLISPSKLRKMTVSSYTEMEFRLPTSGQLPAHFNLCTVLDIPIGTLKKHPPQ